MSTPFANATNPYAWTFNPELVVKSYLMGNLNFPRTTIPAARISLPEEKITVGRTYEGKEGFILSSPRRGLLVHGTPYPDENLWRFSGWAIQPQTDPIFATLAWAVSYAEEEEPLITRDIAAPASAVVNIAKDELDPYLRAGHTISKHLSSFGRVLELTFHTYPLASKQTGIQFIDFNPTIPCQASGIWHDEYHFKYIDWNGATSLTIERSPLLTQAVLAANHTSFSLTNNGHDMEVFAKQFVVLANTLRVITDSVNPPDPELFKIHI